MPWLRSLAVPALCLALAAPPLAADLAVRLTELGAGAPDGLQGLDTAVVGDALYFVGRDGAASRALHRYDGVNPPAPIADSAAADPQELVSWGGRLYFRGGAGDRELWVYDPTGPTLELALDVRPGGNGQPQRFAAFDDRLCFGAFSAANGFELFCWDGVTTPDLLDLEPGAESSFPEALTIWGDRLAFVAQVGGERRLWVYDGVNPPAAVAGAPGDDYDFPGGIAVGADAALYFEALPAGGGAARLWRYDGLTAPTPVSTSFSPWGFPGAPRGRLLVSGEDPASGVEVPELWRLVSAGLERVAPGIAVGSAAAPVAAGGVMYFPGESVPASGDLVLFRLCSGAAFGPSGALAAGGATLASERAVGFRDRILVTADDPEHGEELWQIEPAYLYCDDFETGDAADWH